MIFWATAHSKMAFTYSSHAFTIPSWNDFLFTNNNRYYCTLWRKMVNYLSLLACDRLFIIIRNIMFFHIPYAASFLSMKTVLFITNKEVRACQFAISIRKFAKKNELLEHIQACISVLLTDFCNIFMQEIHFGWDLFVFHVQVCL